MPDHFTSLRGAVMVAFLIWPLLGRSQTVTIETVQVAGGDVILTYSLSDEQVDRKYSLFLFTSNDNFIRPVERASGDIGVGLTVGGNKKIIWHAREELGQAFKGDVSLELKGGIYVPFITLDKFEDYKLFKRGKVYDIVWTGGRGDNVLSFELYRGESKIRVLEQKPNTGKGRLTIPSDVKPGKDYRLKISDSRNKEEVVWSPPFTVKRKVPLLIKAGLVLGAAAVAATIVSDSGSAGEPEIPLPPEATRN